jgi:phosphohistidine phosphatase
LRTRQTVAFVFEGSSPEIRYDDGLYLASVGKLLEVISCVEGNCDQVVVVGHNPGLEELLLRLTGVDQRFPTAALASIALDIDQWPAIFAATGQLDWFVTPKQLADI